MNATIEQNLAQTSAAERCASFARVQSTAKEKLTTAA